MGNEVDEEEFEENIKLEGDFPHELVGVELFHFVLQLNSKQVIIASGSLSRELI